MMTKLSQYSIYYKLLILFIVAASCFRVFICFAHNPMDYLFSDMSRHWDNGLHFPRGGYNAAADPIGYQVYIFVLQKITAGNRFLVAAACSLLSVLMPWTFYRAARNFGLAKIPSLWVWAPVAWTPSLVVIFHFIMMETLLLVLEGVALWATARYLRKGGTKPFLLSIFCWMLAILTKPTVLPLAGVCFPWAWWKRSTPLREIAVGALLATSMLVPQAIRTKLELGFIAPLGNTWLPRIALRAGTRTISFHFHRFDGGDQKLVFGNPSCYVRPLEPVSHWAMRRAWGDTNTSFTITAANDERDWKEVYERFNHDPGRVVGSVAREYYPLLLRPVLAGDRHKRVVRTPGISYSLVLGSINSFRLCM